MRAASGPNSVHCHRRSGENRLTIQMQAGRVVWLYKARHGRDVFSPCWQTQLKLRLHPLLHSLVIGALTRLLPACK